MPKSYFRSSSFKNFLEDYTPGSPRWLAPSTLEPGLYAVPSIMCRSENTEFTHFVSFLQLLSSFLIIFFWTCHYYKGEKLNINPALPLQTADSTVRTRCYTVLLFLISAQPIDMLKLSGKTLLLATLLNYQMTKLSQLTYCYLTQVILMIYVILKLRILMEKLT